MKHGLISILLSLALAIGIIVDWGTGNEEIILLDSSKDKRPRVNIYFSYTTAVCSCANNRSHIMEHSIINSRPQTTALDCLSQHSPSSQEWFEQLGMVNYVVVQVHQNLCVVENPVGKTDSHTRKATELPDQLNTHLSPMSCKFWPW